MNQKKDAKMQEEPPEAYAQAIKDEQGQLILSYMPAFRAVVFRLKERLPSSIDVNDLISIDVEEMVKLSRRCDKRRSNSFWGFVRKRVNGAMLDFLRSLDVMSRSNHKIIKNTDTLTDEYFREHREEPDDEYLVKKLDLDVEKIKEVRTAHAISYTSPIDDQLELHDEDDTLEKLRKEQLLEKIHEILEDLEECNQLIIQPYYYEELSLRGISEILEISESRISQVHKKLLKKPGERLV